VLARSEPSVRITGYAHLFSMRIALA